MDPAALSGGAGALLGLAGAAAALFFVSRAVTAGWDPLVSRYPPADDDGAGERRFQSMSVRLHALVHINLGNVTALRLSERGLRVRVQFPLGWQFKPFELPWSAIEGVELTEWAFGLCAARVRVRDYPYALVFYRAVARDIRERWARGGR